MAKELVARKESFVGLRGIASGVSTRTMASAGKSVSAFLEVRFRLAGHDIVSRVAGDFFSVAEGDEVILSGYVHGDEIEPVAWWNCTNGRGYSPSTWGYRPTVIALIVVSALVLWLLLVKGAGLIQVLFLILPVLVFAGVAYTDYRRRRCAEWVTQTLQGRSHG